MAWQLQEDKYFQSSNLHLLAPQIAKEKSDMCELFEYRNSLSAKLQQQNKLKPTADK